MSLADDQIRNDSYNLLDELSKRENKSKNVLDAIQVVEEFEDGLKRATENKIQEGKTVIDPEMKKEKINQEELIKGIQEEMER